MIRDGESRPNREGASEATRPPHSAAGRTPPGPGRYGRFAPDGRAFIVTDANAPAPWVNVVCDGRYGFVVSHNGGGFSWFDDAQHNVLTRWEMDLPRDDRGKLLYLTDLDSRQVWSAAPAPCRPAYDRFECEHAPGRTTFRTEIHGIAVEWTMGLAWERGAELWTVRVHNRSTRTRRLRLSSYLEWCCGAAPDAKREFHKLFLCTSHDTRRNAILATKTMWDLPGGGEAMHWNRPWPYAAAHAVAGDGLRPTIAIADKTTFLGRYGLPTSPAALLDPPAPGAGVERHGDGIAALGGDLDLAPGEEARLHFTIAIADDADALRRTLDDFRTFDAAETALRDADEQWAALLSDVRITTGWPEFDALNATWLPYQALSGRLFGRTGYYQQSGAFGFRDQLQDSQVWLARRPERTLAQITLHAARQFASGAVEHWWHALADFGNPTECSDDYLWLPFVVANYLRETDDFDALSRIAPFLDGADRATLLDHCRRSLDRAFTRLSPRGLPLIGTCDWNDGLSTVGIEGRGESVWLAFFLIDLLRDWQIILERAGEAPAAPELERRRKALIDAANTHAWDGRWFRRATRDDGRWLGASDSGEGRIFLNPQVWAIMSDGAPPDRAASAWESVREHLLTEYGPLLLAPAYTTPDPTIGYISRYPPGSRENGGVYTHAATWALAAACKRKEPATVAAIWRSLSPILRAARDPDAYAAEPYVLPGNSDGPLAPTPGRAGWTWYTGSAAWLNRICLEWVLGVRPTWGGLTIDPCTPSEIGAVEVVRPWRGVPIHVRFNAAECNPAHRPVVTLNGRQLPANLIRDADLRGATRIDVSVTWTAEPLTPVTRTTLQRTNA